MSLFKLHDPEAGCEMFFLSQHSLIFFIMSAPFRPPEYPFVQFCRLSQEERAAVYI